MRDVKFSLTVSLISDDGVRPVGGGEVIPVEDGDVLRFRLRLSLVNGVKRVIYAPKTLVAGLSVNQYYDKPVVLTRAEDDNSILEYAGETDLEVRHEWFAVSKITPLSFRYPDRDGERDSIVAVREKWRKLGRLGWLSDFEESVDIPKLSACAYLAKREVV